jgi:hypothetical protein
MHGQQGSCFSLGIAHSQRDTYGGCQHAMKLGLQLAEVKCLLRSCLACMLGAVYYHSLLFCMQVPGWSTGGTHLR